MRTIKVFGYLTVTQTQVVYMASQMSQNLLDLNRILIQAKPCCELCYILLYVYELCITQVTFVKFHQAKMNLNVNTAINANVSRCVSEGNI